MPQVSNEFQYSSNRLLGILDRCLAVATIICAMGIISVVTIQIFGRFALTQAPTWTEEVSRWLFIYMVSFAAPLGIRTQSYVGFDSLLLLFPKPISKFIKLASSILILVFSVVLFWYSLSFLKSGSFLTAASLPIKMSSIYVSISILAAMLFLYSLLDSWALFFSSQKGENK